MSLVAEAQNGAYKVVINLLIFNNTTVNEPLVWSQSFSLLFSDTSSQPNATHMMYLIFAAAIFARHQVHIHTGSANQPLTSHLTLLYYLHNLTA